MRRDNLASFKSFTFYEEKAEGIRWEAKRGNIFANYEHMKKQKLLRCVKEGDVQMEGGRRQQKTQALTGLNSTAGDKMEEEAVATLSDSSRASQKEAEKQLDKKNF